MPRMRINAAGIKIAKAGKDVDSAALADMLFDSTFTAARVVMTGTVTVPNPPRGDWDDDFDDQYGSQTVSFGRTFPAPPIVLVAGQLPDGGADITCFVHHHIPVTSGTLVVIPTYQISVTTTSFTLSVERTWATESHDPDLHVRGLGSITRTWRYWVLENVLSTT